MNDKNDIIIEKIKISNLLLDQNNPRLPKSLQTSGEKAILNWMLTNSSLLELMVSIAENGYFSGEPVLVIPSEKNGKYIVVEGNRRLSAIKILNNPDLVTKKQKSIQEIISNAKKDIPQELPVLKFKKESEILDYLGYRHITGIKQWNPLAKARYLDKLFVSRNRIKNIELRYKELANIIGSQGYYVKRMHTTYRVYQKIEDKDFLNVPGLNEDTIEYSNFNDALTKFSHISSYTGIDFEKNDPIISLKESRLKELLTWLFYRNPDTQETRIGEVRNLKKLNAILDPENKYAYKAFISGETLEKAFSLTDEPNKLFTNSLIESFEKLQLAQQLLYNLDNYNELDADTLKKINHLSSDLYNNVLSKTEKVSKIK